jgi:hypothetical protein
MEPWRVSRPFVADLHHFDDEQDPDAYPQQSGKSYWDEPKKVKSHSGSTSVLKYGSESKST